MLHAISGVPACTAPLALMKELPSLWLMGEAIGMGPGVLQAEGHIDERMAASMRGASALIVVDARVAVHASSVDSHREDYHYRVYLSPAHGKQDEAVCPRYCYSQQKLQAP